MSALPSLSVRKFNNFRKISSFYKKKWMSAFKELHWWWCYRPLPRDGGVEELHRDPTVGPRPKV